MKERKSTRDSTADPEETRKEQSCFFPRLLLLRKSFRWKCFRKMWIWVMEPSAARLPMTAGSKTEVEIKDEGVAKAAVASEVKDKNILLNVGLLLALLAVLAAATYSYYRYKKKAAQND